MLLLVFSAVPEPWGPDSSTIPNSRLCVGRDNQQIPPRQAERQQRIVSDVGLSHKKAPTIAVGAILVLAVDAEGDRQSRTQTECWPLFFCVDELLMSDNRTLPNRYRHIQPHLSMATMSVLANIG